MATAHAAPSPPRDDSDFAAEGGGVYGINYAAEVLDLVGFELMRHVYAPKLQCASGMHAAAALSFVRAGALLGVLNSVERMFSRRMCLRGRTP